MNLRDYRSSDFPHVEALWKQTGIYTMERGDTPQIIDRCNAAGGCFLVLEDTEGSVVGTSWLTDDGRRLFLHHFCIHPNHQGKGYGRKLALGSLEFARKKGRPVKLEVHAENEAAVALYRSLGFVPFPGYEIQMLLEP